MRFILKTLCSLTLFLGSVCVLSAPTYGQGFDLAFDFGSELSEFSQSQLAIFDQVESTFESQILGFQPGVSLSGAVIDVSAQPIDGPGIVAGQGGGSSNGITNGGFQFFIPQTNPSFTGTDGVLTSATGTFSTGSFEIDEDDLAPLENVGTGTGNGLFSVVYHEVAHALGFGTLWNENGLVDSDGQYIGANGLATFQAEFDPSATIIPTDGTNAFNAGHWDENSAFLGTDLLSPSLLLGATNPISDTTISTFEDLGFVTITSVPEPSSLMLLASSGLLLLRRRRLA